MGANVRKVTDLGDDRLAVEGTVDGVTGDDGGPLLIVAVGWVSAMENHYPPGAYDSEGNRDPDAEGRPMDDGERRAYWESLLIDAAPTPAAEPTVLYESPEA